MKITEENDAVCLMIKVQPGSSVNKLVGIEGDHIKVKLHAPPVEGKANKALIDLLSDEFSLKRSKIDILSGQRSKIKRVRLNGVDRKAVKKKLELL